jgi:hypothetical protein
MIRTDPIHLIDLCPEWIDHRTQRGVAVAFDCPCRSPHCDYGDRRIVGFTNPLSGGGPSKAFRMTHHRTGDTFSTLVLHPAIFVRNHWHGWLGGSDGSLPGLLVSC